MVLGNEILETPMAWRCRYFENAAYRTLLKEYFAAGAEWSAAPRPMLPDALYDQGFRLPKEGERVRYVTNEFEPVFDAADFIRCGRDLFVTRSHVTNQLGIEWLRRHVGDGVRVHEITSMCRRPMHIDTTLMPLAPGKVLVNPDFVDVRTLPPMFKTWDVLIPPRPDPIDNVLYRRFGMTSVWIGMNVLMLDTERVVVEKSQTSMIRALKDWGFRPIPCSFATYGLYGGSFHCSTLDVRRRGTLQSYF